MSIQESLRHMPQNAVWDGQFDFIVVGAGTAGCLLANRLSASGQHSVLLIEAGGKDDYMWIHIPVGYLYCIDNPRTDWRFRTQAQAGLNGRSLLYPRGKVMGGCSSINGMIYMRGQAADYDDWAAQGNPGWAWDDVLPIFKAMEDHHAGATDFHGAGGEWRVEQQRLQWDVLEAFAQAAAQAGIPRVADFNRGDNFGCSYFEVNQRKGIRWNTSKAFIYPVIDKRPNLDLLAHAHVSRLLFEGIGQDARCIGVQVQRDQRTMRFAARREVLLAAGAVGSPQLLEISGIGQAQRLRDLGIAPVHDLPGVGENLQDHLQLRMAYKVHGVKTLNTQAHSLLGKAKMGLQFMLQRKGPLTMSPSQLGAFAKSDDTVERADVQYHVQPLSLNKFGEPLHTFDALTTSVCHLRPSSRGSIHIASAHMQDAPVINPNYLSTEHDRHVAANALRLTRSIMQQQAMAAFRPEEFMPGPSAQTQEELEQAASQVGTTIFHPVGTCKMGLPGDPHSVVNARLKVHGVASLRVADASIMPTITSGNTNSPTLVIAQQAARFALQDADNA